MAITSIFAASCNPRASVGDLLSAFCTYDFVMPRRVLVRLFTNEWSEIDIYAWRPIDSTSSPLIIDRVSSYETFPGSAGHMFEDHITTNGPHWRNYTIQSLTILHKGREIKIAVTGEIDGVDTETGNPIEIKTRRLEGRKQNSTLALRNYFQSLIASVDTIFSGGYKYQQEWGRVVFKERDFSSLPTRAPSHLNTDAMMNLGMAKLCRIASKCRSRGVLYRADENRVYSTHSDVCMTQDLIHSLAKYVLQKASSNIST